MATPLIPKKQTGAGYNGSGITASTPYGNLPRAANQTIAPMGGTGQGVPLDLQNYSQAPATTGGYDGSGINPTANSTRPAAATGFPAMPNGPMPTIPPGGIPSTPVPATNPQANGISLSLPGINGQNYVATANPYTGTGAPPSTGGWTPVQAPDTPGFTPSPVPGVGGGWNVPAPSTAINTVQDFLGNLLNSGNPYMENAARRGLEVAGARGLLNSSIASGSAQRSAIEAAQPLLNEAMQTFNARENMKFTQGENAADRAQQERLQVLEQNFQGNENAAQRKLTAELQALGINADMANNMANRMLQLQMQREGNAFTSEQNQLNRTQNVNDMLLQNELGLQNMTAENFFRQQMQADATMQQDWLNSQSFSRQFNSALSMIPISNAADLNNYLMQAAISEPEVYTPEVLSGMSSFFNNNLLALLQQYFPNGATP